MHCDDYELIIMSNPVNQYAGEKWTPLCSAEDWEMGQRYEAFSKAICKLKEKNPDFDVERAEQWFQS